MKRLVTEPGSVLAAAPDMLDPNFMHSVVLICRHTEEGAYGFVINRPASVMLDALAPDHPVLGKQSFPVFTGGPVGLHTLQFLHPAPEGIPGGIKIGSGLYLRADLHPPPTHL